MFFQLKHLLLWSTKLFFCAILMEFFLDKRKVCPPGQDFTLCGSPTITHVGTILQDEINQESGHPQVMLIHSGTNYLTLTTPVDNFISDFSVLITQASTMFP